MNHSIIIKFADRIQFLKSLIYFLSILLILGFSSAIAQSNYSLSFDGVDDYISVPRDAIVGIQKGTIEVWIFPYELDSDNWFFSYAMDTYLGIAMCVDINGSLCSQLNQGSGSAMRGTSDFVAPLEWTHVAMSWDGTQVMLYVNGLLDATFENSGYAQDYDSELLIGCDSFHRDYYSFNGIVDEVCIWNRALTQQEIQEKMYQSLNPVSETGLVGYWQFNEGIGDIAHDSSLYSNDGTIYGATWDMDVPFLSGYFYPVTPTGLPYNIVIESAFINNNNLLPGDQIGAFDDTLCVGAITVYDSVENVNLVAWQGDPDHNLPGFIPGNLITFKVLSNLYGTAEVFDPGVTYSVGDGTFGYGSYSVVALDVTTIDVPELTLNTTGIVFDPTPIYTTSTDSFIIQNNGDRNLVITYITSDNSAFTTSFSGSVIIIPSGSEVIYVTFSPDQETYYYATLTIISNDQNNSPAHISVSGLGTEQLVPDWIGFQNTLNLGSAVSGDTIQVNWTIQNNGSDTLQLWGIYTNSEHFFLDVNGCQVSPGDIYLLPVYFAPNSRGLFTADLYFSHNDPDLGQNQIKLNAFGYDGYYQSVEPTGLPYTITVDSVLVDYNDLDCGEEIGVFDGSLCVGVGVKGLDENLQITAWEADPNYGLAGFTTGNTITFKFWGNTFGEDREISLTPDFIQGDGSFGFQPLTVVNLSGFSGFSPMVQLSTTAVTFNPTNVGYSSREILLITNIGNAQLEVNNIQFTSSAFYSNASSFTIASGSTDTLKIYFAPEQPVYYTEELTFNTDDHDHHSVTVQLTGMGIPLLQSHLTVVNPLVEFNPTVIGDTSTAEIIIRNDGNTPLTVNSITSTSNTFFADVQPAQINGGVSMAFQIHFVPDSKGNFNGSFQIHSDAGNGNIHYSSVRGTGYEGYFSSVPPTGLPYHIVIDSISTYNDSSIQIGDEIGIYDEHICVGAGIISNIAKGTLGALVFDGNIGYQDYVEIPIYGFNTNIGSIELWVKVIDAPTGDIPLISITQNNNWYPQAFHLMYRAGGTIHHHTYNYGWTGEWNVYNQWHYNTWHHLALTWNSTNRKLFLDGVLVGEDNNYIQPIIDPSTYRMRIGDNPDWSFLNGYLDEVRLWGIELTQDEIQSRMNTYLTGNENGLIGYWPIELSESSIIDDFSGNGNHGTVNGDVYTSPDVAPVVSSSAVFNDLQITAWEKDESHGLNGFTEGDSITFVVRINLNASPDSTADTYYANAAYSEGDGLFGTGEMSVVDLAVTDYKIDACFFYGSLSGTVTSNKGGPVAEVAVTLLQESEIVEVTMTDSSGFFFIDSLVSGDYTLTLERFHFEPYSSTQPFTVQKPDTTQVDVVLTQIEGMVLRVPDEFGTIQEAIDVTFAEDTVKVAPGTYYENINFNGKNIVLKSTSGPESTIIDGNQNGSVVTFENGEDSTTILEGFTIQNGSAEVGGGIYCFHSNPSLENVTVSGNTASGNGGGISCDLSSPSLENVTVSGNTAESGGGGIFCWNGSNPSLVNVSVRSNTASSWHGGGIYCENGSSPSLLNVTISGNTAFWDGGGITCSNSSPVLESVTISGNMAEIGGGIYCRNISNPSLVNTILWNDSPQEIYLSSYNDSITIAYSNVQGGQDSIVTNDNGTVNWGEGNINVDPQLVDISNDDYHLSNLSPCIDAGDPAYDYSLEPYYNGRRVNMGTYGGTSEATPSSPELTVVDTLNFGNIPYGTTLNTSLYFTNYGTTRLNIDSLFVEIDSTFQLTDSLYMEYLMPGDSESINILFSPAETISYSETLTLYTNDEDEEIKQIILIGTGIDIPPTTPHNLNVVDSLQVITLKWNANSEWDLSHYNIYRSDSLNFTPDSSFFRGNVFAPDTIFVDSLIQNNTTYYYKVTAVDITGNESQPSQYAKTTAIVINVWDVSCQQRTEGSKIVDIYYSFSGNPSETYEIVSYVSINGGDSWQLCESILGGDVGSGISPGENKKIIWDFGYDLPDVFTSDGLIRINVANFELVSEPGISEPGMLDGVNPELEIIYPVSSDSFMYGDTLPIQWIASDSSFIELPIEITYTLDGEWIFTEIDSATENDSLYEWVIPEIPYGNYIIKIKAIDEYGNITALFTDSFFIMGKNPGPYWYVSTDGSDSTYNGTEEFPYSSIQKALDECSPGDTILVSQGIYHEQINTNDKSVYIKGLFGAEHTIIDGDSTGNDVVTLSGNSTITGFTIQHTGENGFTGGIRIESGSPLILYNKIIENNDGIICWSNSNPIIKNNLVARANALILCMDQSKVHIENNTLVEGGEGVNIYSNYAQATAINNIITNNNYGIYTTYSQDSLETVYNDVWNNSQSNYYGLADQTGVDGNISEDPLFIYLDSLNIHLNSTSPAINSGNPLSVYNNEPEPNGDRINMGAYGNTNTAAVGLLKFTTAITDTCLEDSSYSQPFGILSDSGVVFTYSTNAFPGWLSINEDSTGISGIPTNSDVGIHQINISVSDDFSRSDTLLYSLTVINTPPIFTSQPDTSALEDEPYSYDANSSDDGQGEIRYSLTTQPYWLSIDSLTGLLIGIPTNDEVGTYNVTIKVEDGNGGQAIQNYTLHVINVNDPPVLSQLPDIHGIEDSSVTVPLNVWREYVTDDDNSVESLSWYIPNTPNITTTIENDTVIFTPQPDWFGTDSLTILVFDYEDTTMGKIAAIFTNVADPPELTIDDEFYFNEDETLTVYLDDLVYDVDSPDSTMQWQVSFELIQTNLKAIPLHKIKASGSFHNNKSKTFSSPESVDSCLHFDINTEERTLIFYGTPNCFTDSVQIYYAVTDDSGFTVYNSNYVSILSVNDPPVAPEYFTLEKKLYEDIPFEIDLREFQDEVSDIETPTSDLIWTLEPGNAVFIELVLDSNIYIMSSPPDWFGYDTLTIFITDAIDTVSSKLPIYLYPINDPPIITGIPDTSFNEDSTLTLNLDQFVHDVETPNNLLTWDITLASDSSALLIDWSPTSQNLTLIGRQDAFGDSITIFYKVYDDSNAYDYDTSFVSIIPVNDPPAVLASLDTTFYEDSKLNIPREYWWNLIEDVDDPDSTLLINVKKDSGVVFYQFDPDSLIHKFWSNFNVNGAGYFTLTVTDSSGISVSTKFSVSIIPINDPPEIVNIPDTSIAQDTDFYLLLLPYTYDPDNDRNTLRWDFSSTISQTIHEPGSDTLKIIPPESYIGLDTIFATLTDDRGLADFDTFRIKFTDTTPPHFNIGIFQNPIASEHLDFYFFPDEEIDSIITVTIREYDKEVTLLTKIHPSPYYCHHRLIVTDNFPVSISATDTTGNIGSTNYIFSATKIVASLGGIIYSPDSSTSLILPSNALSKDSYILCLPNATKSYNKEKPKELAIAKYTSKTQKLSYNFTGPDKLLKKSAKLLFYPADGYTSSNNNWLGVFQLTSGEWEYRKTYTDKNGIYFWIYTDELGTYKLDVGAPEKPVFLPSKFHLAQNFPNPFNPITTINFSLPEVKNGAFNIPTKLIVYDLLGREVTKLVNKSYLPGKYSISWDSRNSQGVPIASGIYIYRLEYGHYFKSKKMVLIK